MKRQRPVAAETVFRKNQLDYYNRLIYQCRKDLNKHIKITKKFEIQKQIRKVKDVSSQKSDAELLVLKQEKKLLQLKDYCTEPIIDECFRRLGIKQLDPKLQFSSSAESQGNSSDSNASPRIDDPVVTSNTRSSAAVDHGRTKIEIDVADVSLDVHDSELDVAGSKEEVNNDWIVDRIMKHKSMISALEHWNDEVTEYRRWCLRQQERIDGEDSEIYESKNKKGKKSPKKGATDSSMKGSSLFVSLGSSAADGISQGNDSDPYGYYGPGDVDDGIIKKNRQGQRGRRAKAAALEAKKRGRTLRPEESLNWRKPKSEQTRGINSKSQESLSTMRRTSAAQNTNAGGNDFSVSTTKSPSTTPVEELHPSWQARKVQKEGIVAFQGKRITFDEE